MSNTPLTIPASRLASPQLLRNDIDDRVIRIRPAATPLDQISRFAGSRKVKSMQVEYYSATMKESSATVSQAIAARDRVQAGVSFDVDVSNGAIFCETETIVFPDVKVGDKQKPLVAYIQSISGDTLTVFPVADRLPVS
ncbi:MAG: hypothetical protein K2K55_09070, partial [Duncaniella sp.]|nr:hypothetical protein [Duncaniella sp.]